MIKVVVGSKNPVKINAAKQAISQVLSLQEIDCIGTNADSGVAAQPMTSEETLKGATNRVKYCQQQTKANFYVAIEGGVDKFDYGPATFAYVVIADHTQMSIGRSANLPLPLDIYQALQNGEELGNVMDRLFNTHNVKQKGGALSLLTNNIATRESVYTLACVLAMAPFVNSNLYKK